MRLSVLTVATLAACASPAVARQDDLGPWAGRQRSSVVRTTPGEPAPPAPFAPRLERRAPPPERPWTIELGVGLGARVMDDPAFGDADTLFQFLALDVSVQPPRWPVELTLRVTGAASSDEPGFADAYAEDVDRVELAEFDFGLRLPLDLGDGARAHVGAGGAFLEAILLDRERRLWWDDYDEVDSDGELGWWAGAGVGLPLGGGHALGLDARWSGADVRLGGREVELDGWSLLVGWTWRRPLPR